jgi:plasmid stabilization system protein ParE
VACVEVSTRVHSELERLFDFVAEADPKRALAHPPGVRAAFEVPADHPLLGRVAEDGRRPQSRLAEPAYSPVHN